MTAPAQSVPMGRTFHALFGVLFATPAWAGELDRDTESRHDRASSSSSSSYDDDDDDDDTFDFDDGDDYGTYAYGSGGTGGDPSTGDLRFSAGLLFDRMAGINGGRVVHQDAVGFGLDFTMVIHDDGSTKSSRSGWFIHARYGFAPLLDDFTPRGADYSSTLILHALEADAGPYWVRESGGLQVRGGLGVGFALLRAHEEFTDGLSLDENLTLGLRLRPHVTFTPVLDKSRPFLDLGLGIFMGHVTNHVEEYDSLIDGLFPVMVTPYTRVGWLFELQRGLWFGGSYELGFVGTVWASPSITHRGQVLIRLTGEDDLPSS